MSQKIVRLEFQQPNLPTLDLEWSPSLVQQTGNCAAAKHSGGLRTINQLFGMRDLGLVYWKRILEDNDPPQFEKRGV